MKTFLEYVNDAQKELEESEKSFMDLVEKSLKMLRAYFNEKGRDEVVEVDERGLFKKTKEYEANAGIERDEVEKFLKDNLHEDSFMVKQIIGKLIRDKWLQLQDRKNTPFAGSMDLLLPTKKFVDLPISA